MGFSDKAFFAIGNDEIGNLLEGEKRDREWKEKRGWGERESEKSGYRFGRKAGIFEASQYQKVGRDAGNQVSFGHMRLRGSFDCYGT